jgi:hypothetical protein
MFAAPDRNPNGPQNRRLGMAPIKLLGSLVCLVAWASLAFGQTQVLYIPQVVDGGNWQTNFALTNTTTSPASVSMSFQADSAGGATQPWMPPFLEVSSTANLVIAAASTTYLHTAGIAPNLSQGYALVTADPGVAISAIFTIRNPGRQDLEGTALATASAARILVPFDNTSGNVTSVGIVNPTGVAETVLVNVKTASGTVVQGFLPSIPANGHMTFTLPQQFPAIAGQSGLAEFYVTTGTLSLLAFQFTASGAFTASPVYLESGPPVISGTVSGGGAPIPLSGNIFRIVGTTTISGKSLTLDITGEPSGNQYLFNVDDSPSSASGVDFIASIMVPLTVAGNTVTFQTPAPTALTANFYSDTTNTSNPINGDVTAETITITFTSLNLGATVTGTVNFTVNGSTVLNYNVQSTFSGTITMIQAI